MSGTPSNDIILGLQGADTIRGNDGLDVIQGDEDRTSYMVGKEMILSKEAKEVI